MPQNQIGLGASSSATTASSWMTPATLIAVATLLLMALKTYTEVKPVIARPSGGTKRYRRRKRSRRVSGRSAYN